MDEIGRDTVFVSYSHADRPWLDRLLVLLSPLVRNRRMRVWADPHITVGDEWRRDLSGAIGRAGSAVLLVSGDFLASDFIMREELPALVAGGVRLAPVLLRDCLWEHEPLLNSVQWAHDPGRDGPIDRGAESPADRDGRLVRVCRRLIELVDIGAGTAAPVDNGGLWTSAPPVESLTTSTQLGAVDGVPPRPAGYVERGDLIQLRSALLQTVSGAVGVTGDVAALGLHGQGGIGKSVLAAAVAADPQVRTYFPDGVFWVTVGERADVVAVQVDLLRRLGRPGAQVRSVSDGLRLLREALQSRRALLVVDDVWSDADAAAFRAMGPQGRILYTTRDARVLGAVRADTHKVDVLTESVSRQLLIHITGADVPTSELTRILSASGRVPLALALLGAAVRSGLTWSQVADDLDRGSRIFLDHPYANTFKAMQVATATLPLDVRDAYLSLAVYPQDTAIPVQSVIRFWGHTRDMNGSTVREHLNHLAEAELLRVVDDRLTFHDLQHDYLLLQADDLSVLHADLLGAYRNLLLDGGEDGWWRLPRDEPYIWDHLVHHLRSAGDRPTLQLTVLDPAFLAVRIWQGGTHGAEADLAIAALLNPGAAPTAHLQAWLARHAHIFSGVDALGDVAAILHCWLTAARSELDLARLRPLLPSVHLRYRWGRSPLPATALRTLGASAGGRREVAFSHDGTLLASASDVGSTVIVWTVPQGRVQAELTGHDRLIPTVFFSPDGRTLITGDDQGARLWDVETGRERRRIPGRVKSSAIGLNSLDLSPGGRLIALASRDATEAQVWNVETGRLHRTFTVSSDDIVTTVRFAPGGRTLAVATKQKTLTHRDIADGRLVTQAHMVGRRPAR